MTDVDDWAAAIEQQEKEQLTGKVEWCLVWCVHGWYGRSLERGRLESPSCVNFKM